MIRLYHIEGGFQNRGSTSVCRSKPVTAAAAGRYSPLGFPALCCPGALHTGGCKRASSQWPVLSVQLVPALLCPGKRICSVYLIIIPGLPEEVKPHRLPFLAYRRFLWYSIIVRSFPGTLRRCPQKRKAAMLFPGFFTLLQNKASTGRALFEKGKVTAQRSPTRGHFF